MGITVSLRESLGAILSSTSLFPDSCILPTRTQHHIKVFASVYTVLKDGITSSKGIVSKVEFHYVFSRLLQCSVRLAASVWHNMCYNHCAMFIGPLLHFLCCTMGSLVWHNITWGTNQWIKIYNSSDSGAGWNTIDRKGKLIPRVGVYFWLFQGVWTPTYSICL